MAGTVGTESNPATATVSEVGIGKEEATVAVVAADTGTEAVE